MAESLSATEKNAGGARVLFREIRRTTFGDMLSAALFVFVTALMLIVITAVGSDTHFGKALGWLYAALVNDSGEGSTYMKLPIFLIIFLVYVFLLAVFRSETVVTESTIALYEKVKTMGYPYAHIREAWRATYVISYTKGFISHIHATSLDQKRRAAIRPPPLSRVSIELEHEGVVIEFIDHSAPTIIPSRKPAELLTALNALVERRNTEGLPSYSREPVTPHGLRERFLLRKEGGQAVVWSAVFIGWLGVGLVSEAILLLATRAGAAALAVLGVALVDFAGGYAIGKALEFRPRQNGIALGVSLIVWQMFMLANRPFEQLPILICLALVAVPATYLGTDAALRNLARRGQIQKKPDNMANA